MCECVCVCARARSRIRLEGLGVAGGARQSNGRQKLTKEESRQLRLFTENSTDTESVKGRFRTL